MTPELPGSMQQSLLTSTLRVVYKSPRVVPDPPHPARKKPKLQKLAPRAVWGARFKLPLRTKLYSLVLIRRTFTIFTEHRIVQADNSKFQMLPLIAQELSLLVQARRVLLRPRIHLDMHQPARLLRYLKLSDFCGGTPHLLPWNGLGMICIVHDS